MARYVKTQWNTTTVFNPTNMNHIEQGIYDADLREGGTIGGVLNINIPSPTTSTYDSSLILGNNIPNGTQGSSRGVVRIFDKNQYSGTFLAGDGSLTDNRYLKIPDINGFIATTTQEDVGITVVDQNVTLDWNKSCIIGGTLYLIIKAHYTGTLNNTLAFNVNIPTISYAIFPIGVGTEWNIGQIGYGYIGMNAGVVIMNISAGLSNGYFHICQAMPYPR